MRNIKKFETPILFITFNKLDTTKKILKKIIEVNPKYLIIASDGPRNNKEEKVITNLRHYFEKEIQFDFIQIYSDINRGCKEGVTHAINKSFELFDELIIVEDDTLPTSKFFYFCEKLLKIYKEDKKVNLVSGYNYLSKSKTKDPFYFSKYSMIWGWATWKDRWEERELLNKNSLDYFEKNKADNLFTSKEEKKYFMDHFSDVINGYLDTWDFGLVFSNFYKNKLTIVPKYNLVKNIGLGHKSATHTKSKLSFKIVTFNLCLDLFQSLNLNYINPVASSSNDSNYRNKVLLKNTIYNRILYFFYKRFYT